MTKNIFVYIVSVVLGFVVSQACFAENASGGLEKEKTNLATMDSKPDLVVKDLEKGLLNYEIQNDNNVNLIKNDLMFTKKEISLLSRDIERLKSFSESDKQVMDQTARTLALFFQIASLFLAMVTIGLAILAFFGFKNLRELRKEEQQMKKEVLGQSQEIIRKVMASDYGKTTDELSRKIYKLECYVDIMKVFLAQKGRVPLIPEDQGEGDVESEESPNTFDQT